MSSVNHNRMLAAVSKLSREYGTEEYAIGGGGNSSCKNTRILWVKPSGTRLADMSESKFVALDRARLSRLYDFAAPDDPKEREGAVKSIVMGAVQPDSAGRPSVETPLHDSMAYRYVLHVHPPLVNGLTCSLEGATASQKILPDALWVDYTDPGYTLCMRVREAIALYSRTRGVQPAVIVLQNHGVFVGGDSLDDIRGRYGKLSQRLLDKYKKEGISVSLPFDILGATSGGDTIADMYRAVWPDEPVAVRAAGAMPVADGPLSPDHIVYAKAYAFVGNPTAETLSAFRNRHGYRPRVIATPHAVYAISDTEQDAELILKIVHDGALVKQLADAFGGVRFMDRNAAGFIEDWEAESYRRQINA